MVLEKSSFDDADINAQRVRALHHLAQSLGVQIQSDEVDDTQKQEPAAKPTHSNDAVNTNASSASKEGDLEEISKEERKPE